MTAKKDLKKRVRARQQQTGERYTTALERVKRRATKPRVPVMEAPDLTASAARAGLKCRAYCSFAFWNLTDDDQARSLLAQTALERLAQVLRVTKADPSTALLRSALLHGKSLSSARAFGLWHGGQLRSFTERLRLGVRGTSEGGQAIAFEAPDPRGRAPLVLVAMLWPSSRRDPLLHLSLASEWLRAKPFLEGLTTVFEDLSTVFGFAPLEGEEPR